MANSPPLIRLLSWLRPYRREVAFSVLLGVLTIGSSIALMATSAWMISKAGLQPSIADLGVSVVAVRFFGITRGIFRYLERLVSHDTTFRLLAAIRVSVYRAIEPLAPARLAVFRSGDLLARAVADVDALQNVYLRAVAPFLVALVTAALLALLIGAFDLFSGVVALAWFALSGAALMALAWGLGERPGRDLVDARSRYSALFVDSLQGLPDLIAYGADGYYLDMLSSQADDLAALERRFARFDALQLGLMILFPVGAMIMLLAVAIPRVDGVYLATLALATLAAYEAILPLGQAASAMGSSLEAAERLFDLIDTTPAVRDPAAPSPIPIRSDIEIRHLVFRYAPDLPPVFKDLNLDIAQGEHVAVVGESGAGKSTLANLLVRFWEVEEGSIRVGGVELHDLAQENTRRIFGVLAQTTHLFNTSIRENIRIARPDADDQAVESAAQAAQIHDFIAALPQGYEALAGENGVKLSGGERQRIALARALLKDAPILILDEATAHLDAKTEREVMRAVLKACEKRTLILFTHNPNLLPWMDRVIKLPSLG